MPDNMPDNISSAVYLGPCATCNGYHGGWEPCPAAPAGETPELPPIRYGVRDLLITDSFVLRWLSVRTASALANSFPRNVLGERPTIGAVIDASDEELLRLANIGPIAVEEIRHLRIAVARGENAADAPPEALPTDDDVRHAICDYNRWDYTTMADSISEHHVLRDSGAVALRAVLIGYGRALCARIAERDRDTELLDALDRLRVDVERHDPGRGDPLHVGYLWKITGHLHQRDVRSAIDAARAPQEAP